MPKGFARVAAVSLPVHLGDVAANEQEIFSAMEPLRRQGVRAGRFSRTVSDGLHAGRPAAAAAGADGQLGRVCCALRKKRTVPWLWSSVCR